MPHPVRKSILLAGMLAIATVPTTALAGGAGSNDQIITPSANGGGARLAVSVSGREPRGSWGSSSTQGETGYEGGGQEATAIGQYASVADAQKAAQQQLEAACGKGFTGAAGASMFCTQGGITPLASAAPQASGAPAAPAPPPAALLGAQAVLQLQFPLTMPHIGPPPSVNQWRKAFVGYPLWLWSNGETTLAQQTTVMGYPVSLQATRSAVHYDMGDGGSVDCATSTPWVQGSAAPGVPSPDCGYTYQKAGTYQVTAVVTWTVTWTALGQSGTIPVQKAGRVTLLVGELEAIVTSQSGK